MKKLCLTIIVFLYSQISLAGPLNYNNISLGYAIGSDDTAEIEGIAVIGQKLLTPNIVVQAFIVEITDSSKLPSGYSVDGRAVSLSLFGLAQISTNIDLLAGVEVARAKAEIDTPSGSTTETDTHKDLEASINFSTDASYEVNIFISRDIGEDENETEYGIGGSYFLNKNVSIGLRYFENTSSYDYSEKQVILKYNFE